MEQKINVGWVQINEQKDGLSRSRKSDDKKEYQKEFVIIPYSVGILQAYAQEHATTPENYEFMLPVFKRERVSEAVEKLKVADLVGFSVYVWNINLSLAIAKSLRQTNPDVLIVFGGPQVPDFAENFLTDHPFIDIVCHGEGEAVFLQILENSFPRKWENIPSVSYFDTAGDFISHPKAPRIKDLNSIPSPYLSGVFDPLMAANPDSSWIMLWESNRGCPFSCTFCDWGSATNSKVSRFEMKRLFRELEWSGKNQVQMIFCCDANFGILARDEELAEFAALIKKAFGKPRILSVQNTKNATERAFRVQKILTDANLNPVVTLSLQSLNEDTLEAIKRKNISTSHFQELQKRYTKEQVPTYTDVILSMPGETYDSYVNGICRMIDGGQHNRVLYYNLSILPNAEMGQIEYQEKYKMEAVQQPILLMHTSINEVEEVPEFLETVIATESMPREAWLQAKKFWWISEFLYFNNTLKITLLSISHYYDVSLRLLIEPFLTVVASDYPVITRMNNLMNEQALTIQDGGPEYIASEDHLGIYWDTNQYLLIDLTENDLLDAFFVEAKRLLGSVLSDFSNPLGTAALSDALALNASLLHRPGIHEDLYLDLKTNVFHYSQALLAGEAISLKAEPYQHRILRSTTASASNTHTWEDWLEHLVACQNFKEKYVYEQEVQKQINTHVPKTEIQA